MSEPEYDGDPLDRIPVEELEQAIVDISAGIKRMLSGRLTKRAILVLITDNTPGVTLTTIRQVLEGIEGLEQRYLNPKPDKKGGK